MSDLSAKFHDALAAERPSVGAEARAAVLARATAASRSSRRSHLAVTAFATLATAAIAGTGTWLVADQVYEPAAPEPTPSPSATTNKGPWDVDWDGTFQPPGLLGYSPDYRGAPDSFDDGLDHANLPPLVARTSSAYPQAHELTDEVWEHVGAGWGVAEYGAPQALRSVDEADLGSADRTPALHLVSPEGVHFKLPNPVFAPSFAEPGEPGWVMTYQVTYVDLERGWIVLDGASADPDPEGVSLFQLVMDARTGAVLSMTDKSAGIDDDTMDYTHEGHFTQVAGPFEGGAAVWLEGDENAAGVSGVTLTVRSPGGEVRTLPRPETGGGTPFVIMDPSGANSTVALYGTWSRDGSEPDRLWLLDVSTGTFSAVPSSPPVVDGEEASCLSEATAVDGASVTRRCWFASGEDSFVRIPLNGSPATRVDTQDFIAAMWGAAGFDPGSVMESVGGDFLVTRVDDISSGARVAAFTVDPTVFPDGAYFWPPIMVGAGRFLVYCRYGEATAVIGYDRTSGTSFTLESAVIPDTGAWASLGYFYVIPATPDLG